MTPYQHEWVQFHNYVYCARGCGVRPIPGKDYADDECAGAKRKCEETKETG